MPSPEELVANQGQQDEGSEETFEQWLSGQDDGLKAKYAAHTSGLTSALAAERETNKKTQAQLRDLARKAEKGSELETELTRQADVLKTIERQAAFQDKAHSQGVRNLRLAFLAASSAGLIREDGDCDFVKLRADYPELFTVVQSANAGAGTGNPAGAKTDMNTTLRNAFGL